MIRFRPRSLASVFAFAVLIGALLVFVRVVVIPWMLGWQWDTWEPLLRRGIQVIIGLVIITGLVLACFRWIPDGRAATIHAFWRSEPHTQGGIQPFFNIPFMERVDWHDMRERTTEFRCVCLTQDLIPITVRVYTRWQPDVKQLAKIHNLKVEQVQSLENLIAGWMIGQMGRLKLEQVVQDMHRINLELYHFIANTVLGAPRFGILVNEIFIAGLDAPSTKLSKR